MKEIYIPKIILRHPSPYLFDGEKYDIVGAILAELGHKIPEKTKFPSNLDIVISHFTCKCKGKIIDTELTIALSRLEIHPQKNAFVEANKLLERIGIQIK